MHPSPLPLFLRHAPQVARAGVAFMYDHFDFVRDGRTYKLRDALSTFTGSFSTGFIRGSKPKPASFELEVPYEGRVLTADALHVQLDRWVRRGVVELSCAAAIGQVAQTPAWLDLSDRYFVLLGASAAMGPLSVLLSLGANVIAVDLDQPRLWRRLIAQAQASCGTLTFPLAPGAQQHTLSHDELCAAAGCNLCTHLPELRHWLLQLHPHQPLCVGGYAYVPGEYFPRVALAMDVLIEALSEQRAAAVAFLCTPTDCHLIPAAAHAAAEEARRRAPWWQLAAAWASGGRLCAPNARAPVATAAGGRLYVCDALVIAQGPNYALAKRLQHWRAVLAHASGCLVSSNIAPSTRTASVTQNRHFAHAYDALPAFPPYEVPHPETSNAVMAALLLHDLHTPHPPLASPLLLFARGAFHGGAWRCAWRFDSIGALAVALYYWRTYVVRGYLLAYNALQAAGWGAVLLRLAAALAASAHASWWECAWPLFAVQNAALLEPIHAALHVVRAPLLPTALQVASRVGIVHLVAATPELHSTWPLLLLALAWGLTEVVRYSWYAINTLTTPARPHSWLRYSTFIVLYPLGVAGELLYVYSALDHLEGVPVLGVRASTIVWCAVYPSYAVGLPILYVHMLRQRAKALSQRARTIFTAASKEHVHSADKEV
ncbi:hypothetical protein AB1Y20_007323 [Prymnesium parvum]|uniref:very-long-chain (3R)-3-hydroxyacyl-CoA dehydratase n=1 Tax=Prymnesium parvum TaxID=97485 RepID=A0AB34IYA2_PRYPA